MADMKNIELMTMLKGMGIVLVVLGHAIVAKSLPHNFICKHPTPILAV